tara:strand:- start:930 stop:1541 length:612 start_codon:yes stop_codon:yes gene_type:complete
MIETQTLMCQKDGQTTQRHKTRESTTGDNDMTNRGTARKMSLHHERNPDAWGEEKTPLVRKILGRVNRPHHERHPNDHNTPRDRGICYTSKKKKDRRKDIQALHVLLDMQDREKSQRHPRRIIQSVAHEYMVEFWLRRDYLLDDNDPDPDPPYDADGEIIDYPSGRGGGKNAIVDWLFKYNQLYHERKAQNALTEGMNQTLQG